MIDIIRKLNIGGGTLMIMMGLMIYFLKEAGKSNLIPGVLVLAGVALLMISELLRRVSHGR
jgi:hypothetical protein